ncbi:hypothetical protein [Hyalangium rubrum]|uniref:Uncharacterized protein n=1 Tax=Hyalangium rubrum TaxID=3103134 RepID=A0ABU5HER8_9BACT|nr:hypothetical protein [Hyalangium sp. s54d21]MDY7231964.1 hypothetical protein [Hyalangium sp. s54d21]
MPRAIHAENTTRLPVTRAHLTLGLEIEGLLNVSRTSGTMSEKAEYNPNKGFSFGIPKLKYELDQIFGAAANVSSATAEVVTAPFAVTGIGLKELLQIVREAYTKAPSQMTFTPSADFGGSSCQGRISKVSTHGSCQANMTIRAETLFQADAKKAKAIWSQLTTDEELPKILPLVAAANTLVNTVAEDNTAPLHAYWNSRVRLKLWFFQWLSFLSFEVAAELDKLPGLAKDFHGCTIKGAMDPRSNGVPYLAATTLCGLYTASTGAVAAPLDTVYDTAITAIATSIGATEEAVRDHWTDDAVYELTRPEPPATERPLKSSIVNNKIAPILEMRHRNAPVNAAMSTAIHESILSANKISTQAAEVLKVLKPLI